MRLGTVCPELSTYAGTCFTEFMRLIYLSRPDIQKRFSINDIFSRTILLTWYHTHGRKDIKMFATDLPQPQWDLLNEKCEETGSCQNHFFTKMQSALWLASSLAKEHFDLDQLEDRLSIEILVSACVQKPQGVEQVLPSKEALTFANNNDPDFSQEIPIGVCRLLSSVWKARKDLQAAFPNDSAENNAALVLWFLKHGVKELDMSVFNIKSLDKEYLVSDSSELSLNWGTPIPRILHQIWCSNKQYQAEYNLQSEEGRMSFLSWFKEKGIENHELTWLFEERSITISHHQASDFRLPDKRSGELASGINIIGNAQGGFGMSQHAIMTAVAAQSAGINCAIVDMNASTSIEGSDAVKFGCNVVRECLYSVNLAAFTPAMLPHEFAAIGLSVVENCHNIYYGNWEYPQYPPDHITVIEGFDEIWAPSKFTFEGLKNIISKPLHYVPLAVTVGNLLPASRADFNLPDNAFLFLNTFDFHSNILRKNPYGCVRAFIEAFPNGNEPVGLVIKAMNIRTSSESFAEWRRVREAAQADSRIIFIEEQLTRHKIDSLVNLCDAFISLHRAEGFGLAIAEAMFMGKPVIVTNYSGNTEFTLASNSCLVDSVIVRPPENVLKRLGVETTWADPDISQAAWYMRKLFTEQNYRTKLAEFGQQYILENYSPSVIGYIIKSRLDNRTTKSSIEAMVTSAIRI